MDSMDAFCSPALQKKIVQGAVKTAANVVSKDAERRLGKGKGHVGVGMRRKTGTNVAAVGIGIKKKHWTDIFTEYGKGIARHTKKGYYRGLSRTAKPFLRPAMDANKENVLNKIKDFMEITVKTIFVARQREVSEPPIELT
jgi:HK97 gp10 family phage protein